MTGQSYEREERVWCIIPTQDKKSAFSGCHIHQMNERPHSSLHTRIAKLVCMSSIPRARFLTLFFDFFTQILIHRAVPACAWPIPGGPAPRFLRRFAPAVSFPAPFRCRFSGLNSPSWRLPGNFHDQRGFSGNQAATEGRLHRERRQISDSDKQSNETGLRQ